jgi:hypothetical protein
MLHVHRPPFIAPTSPNSSSLGPAAAANTPADAPTSVSASIPIDHLLCHGSHGLLTEQRPEMPIAKRRLLLNQRPELIDPGRVQFSPRGVREAPLKNSQVRRTTFWQNSHPSQEIPMRHSKFTETKIVSIPKEAGAGRPVNEIWRSTALARRRTTSGMPSTEG